MHKTQVFIREDQREALQSVARVTGKNQSTLIREGIDWYLQRIKKNQEWKSNLKALAGSLSNAEADEMKAALQISRAGWKNREQSF